MNVFSNFHFSVAFGRGKNLWLPRGWLAVKLEYTVSTHKEENGDKRVCFVHDTQKPAFVPVSAQAVIVV